MKDNLYTVTYAAVLAVVCATALTAVNRLTADDEDLRFAEDAACGTDRVIEL